MLQKILVLAKVNADSAKISHGNETIQTWSNENEAPSALSHKNDAIYNIIGLK